MVTAPWLSSAVEKTWLFLVGIVVLRSISGEHAAQRLDAQRQRGHVEQQHVLDVALQHAGLDRRAHGDDLVRVDALVRLLAEELLHDSCTLGMRVMPPTSTTSSISAAEAGILQRLAARLDVRWIRSSTSARTWRG
jgi:hypothetical protein